MTDSFSPQDEKIIKRLGALRNAGPDYPAELLEKRRATFHKAVVGLTSLGLLAGLIRWLMRIFPNATSAMVQTGIEIFLVGVLVVESSVATYVFRSEIKQLLGISSGSGTPIATQSSGIPEFRSTEATSNEPSATAVTETETPTATPTATATPTRTRTATPTYIYIQPTQNPQPTQSGPTPTDPGHHYGQTKTPLPNGAPNSISSGSFLETPVPVIKKGGHSVDDHYDDH